MSNQKKCKQARLQEAEFAKMTSKRDREIMQELNRAIAQKQIPRDKNKMAYFYSGAVWADEHPALKNKLTLFFSGFATGIFGSFIVYLICILAV